MKRLTKLSRDIAVPKITARLYDEVVGEWRYLGFAYLFDPAGLVQASDLKYFHQMTHILHHTNVRLVIQTLESGFL